MEKQQLLRNLIDAREFPDDYYFLIEAGLTTPEELARLASLSSEKGRDKYNHAVRAFYEMKQTKSIVGTSELEDSLEFFREARNKEKPHISIQLLKPGVRRPIEIDLPFSELTETVRSFVLENACNNFAYGVCIDSCPFNMKWDEQFNCYNVTRTAYELLRKYSDHEVATRTMMEIMQKN